MIKQKLEDCLTCIFNKSLYVVELGEGYQVKVVSKGVTITAGSSPAANEPAPLHMMICWHYWSTDGYN